MPDFVPNLPGNRWKFGLRGLELTGEDNSALKFASQGFEAE